MRSAAGQDIRPPRSTPTAYLDSIELRILINGNRGAPGLRVTKRSLSSYVVPRTREAKASYRQTRQMPKRHDATVARHAEPPYQQDSRAVSSQSGASVTLPRDGRPVLLKPPAACTGRSDPDQRRGLTDAELKTMIDLSCTFLSDLLGVQAPKRAKSLTGTSSDQHKVWRLVDVIPTLMIPGLTDQILTRQQLIRNILKCLVRHDEKKLKLKTRSATRVDSQNRAEKSACASRPRIEELLWLSMVYHLKRDKKRGQVKVRCDASPQEARLNRTDAGRPLPMVYRGASTARIAQANDLLPQHPSANILSSPGVYTTQPLSIPLKGRMHNSQPARPAFRRGITQTSAMLKTENPQGSGGSHLAESWLTQTRRPALLNGYSLSQIPVEPMLPDIYEVDMMLRSSPCPSDSSSSLLLQEDWDFDSPDFDHPTISNQSNDDLDLQDIHEEQPASPIPNNLQYATMPRQHAQESLSDVLGDDRSLWSMFARRGSSATQQDNMVDMYRNDPDMRLLSKGEPSSDDFSDLMMLDNFNFTRSSSTTSTASSASSVSNESLSRSSTRGIGIYPSSQPLAANSQSKRPALLKRISRSGRTSDEAPRSSTKPLPRDTDIRRRKTIKDYE